MLNRLPNTKYTFIKTTKYTMPKTAISLSDSYQPASLLPLPPLTGATASFHRASRVSVILHIQWD